MHKSDILRQLRRIADANGGIAPGWRKFEAASGIKYADWCGVYWARWNDAVREAGLTPNQLTVAYDESELLGHYAALTAELGRLPTGNDLRMKVRSDPDFPNSKTFDRLASKKKLAIKLADYCSGRPELSMIKALASQYIEKNSHSQDQIDHTVRTDKEEVTEGFVYMMRFGKHYKIGHTTAVPRRHREISLELPEKPSVIHYIRTDDPEGIEAYWHKRFATFRSNGEWFSLTSREIRIFQRRKTM